MFSSSCMWLQYYMLTSAWSVHTVKHCLGPEMYLIAKICLLVLSDWYCSYDVVCILTKSVLVPTLLELTFKRFILNYCSTGLTQECVMLMNNRSHNSMKTMHLGCANPIGLTSPGTVLVQLEMLLLKDLLEHCCCCCDWWLLLRGRSVFPLVVLY